MLHEAATMTWRTLTAGDAKAATELLTAIEAADRTGVHYTEQDLLQELLGPDVDLERASLAAFAGDVMVGYVKAVFKPSAQEEHRIFLDGGVHPAYRRRGLGTVLLQAGVAAAGELHALHHPGLRLVTDVWTAEDVTGPAELFRGQGFTPVRFYQHMVHPLGDAIPDAAVPDGLRLEPWSAAHDEDFRSVRNDAFRDHWGSSPVTVESWQHSIASHTFRPELSFLLRDTAGGAPAGMLTTACREADTAATGVRDAHFTLIGTCRQYRRRGVAGALIGHALRAAAAAGYDRASLHVDAANPTGAFGVYEKAGFTPEKRFARWAKPAQDTPAQDTPE